MRFDWISHVDRLLRWSRFERDGDGGPHDGGGGIVEWDARGAPIAAQFPAHLFDGIAEQAAKGNPSDTVQRRRNTD